MELSIEVIIAICVLFFAVALLYSSVGHGGAPGYITVLSFFSFAPMQMSTTALILNLLVAGIGLISGIVSVGGVFSSARLFYW